MSRQHISDQYIPAAFLGDLDSKETAKALGLSTNSSVSVRSSDTKCAKCKAAIVGAGVNANGGVYHQKCFACSQCFKPIPAGIAQGYATLGDDLWCTNCVRIDQELGRSAGKPKPAGSAAAGAATSKPAAGGSHCAKCSKALAGKFVKTKEGTAYHKECFLCVGCAADLSAGYKMLAGGPHCGSCLNKQQDPFRNKIPPAALVDSPAPGPAAAAGGGAKFCGECGKPNTGGAASKFCAECGSKF